MEDFFVSNIGAERTFKLFGTPHLIAMLILVIIWIAIPLIMSRIQNDKTQKRFRYTLATIMAIQHVGYFIWIALIGDFSINTLPLHLCGISNILAIVILITKNYTAYELVYFMGIGGAIQAIVTPDVIIQFPHFQFIQTFIHHGGIILVPLYMTFVEGYRPTLKSLGKVFLFVNGYLLVIYIFNLIAGTNYLFLTYPPEDTIIVILEQWFGPSPNYIIGLELVGMISVSLLYIPFGLYDLIRKIAEWNNVRIRDYFIKKRTEGVSDTPSF